MALFQADVSYYRTIKELVIETCVVNSDIVLHVVIKKMRLNRDELKDACYEVATNTMWDRRPIDVADIQAVADRFFKIAEFHEEFVTGQGRDPNLIVRAVRYLNHAHAMPPMRDDTRWFDDMLQVLVELACPNTGASPELEPFFRDIEEGIEWSRSDYANAESS